MSGRRFHVFAVAAVLTGAQALSAGATLAGPALAGKGSGVTDAVVTNAVKQNVERALEQSSLLFVPNGGQHTREVAFTAMGTNPAMFFTRSGITYSLTEQPKARAREVTDPMDFTAPKAFAERAPRKGWAVRQEFLGARPTQPIGTGIAPGKVNYLVGPLTEHVTGLATYEGITYPELWDGIDLHYRGQGGALKYEFHLAPGADPTKIRLSYRGARSVKLTPTGELLIKTPVGSFSDAAPVAWQDIAGQRVPVDVAYLPASTNRQRGYAYGFGLGAYDPAQPLVIDPAVLVYSTYLGGSGFADVGFGIAVDADGAAYVTGTTVAGVDFPTTTGAFDTSLSGETDAFVTKITPAGAGAADLSYSTYLGGSSGDEGRGIAVDAAGAAYVTGLTDSTDFPTTTGAFDTVFNGGFSDAFVTKITPAGAGAADLSYSTYLGGSGLDQGGGFGQGGGIAVDAAGAAYVTGVTASADFPTTTGAFDTSLGPCCDAFVTKITPAGAGLADLSYSTYLGGSDFDQGGGIAVDASGAAYVTGLTTSGDFPTTTGAFDASFNGGCCDAFVTKITPAGAGLADLAYSTYLGGSDFDQGGGIAADASGAAYVTGRTDSGDFPTTPGAFDALNGAGAHAFVTKITPAGAGAADLAYSTYLGGSVFEEGRGIAVDGAGAAYVTGSTSSTDFPTTTGAFDTDLDGGVDAFVTKITPAGAGLADLSYSTYLGGSSTDVGNGIAVDAAGAAYVTGETSSTDFPTTTGAFDTSFNGDSDAFVTKISDRADLEVFKAAAPEPALVGERLTYKIEVDNDGHVEADDVKLKDPLPAGVDFVSVSSTEGSCTFELGTVRCKLGDIEPGDQVDVVIEVIPTAPGTLENEAEAKSDTPDEDAEDNEDSVTSNVIAAANLALTTASSPEQLYAGEDLTLTHSVSNSGPLGAEAVELTDQIPDGTDFVSASSSQGSCAAAGGVVRCALGTLGAGDGADVTVTVKPRLEGEFTDNASVSSALADPDPTDDATVTTIIADPSADVLVTMEPSAARVDANERLDYLVTLANAGPSAATEVTLTDPLPSDYELSGVSTSQGSCTADARTVSCALGTIASGAQASIQIQGTATRAGTYDNSATVSASTHDPAPVANNWANVTTIVGDVGPPQVTLTRAAAGHLYFEAAGIDLDLGPSVTHAVIATPVSQFELRADATDDFALERVDFYVNGIRVCSDTAAPYTCAWVPMVSSLARVEAQAVDAWGNVSARDGVDVLVGL